jgi:hypothetical protein
MVRSVLTDEQAHHQRQVRDAQERVLAATALLEVRVIAARSAGMSWNLIGRAMGIARQSAQQRFEKLPELRDDREYEA